MQSIFVVMITLVRTRPNPLSTSRSRQQFQIQNILPILHQRSIVAGGVGRVRPKVIGKSDDF
jgi:hypothetical protein